MNPDDIHKTAICTPFGLFESTRMQFGLCGASATFQRFIDEVTRNLEGVYAFVDNILIASRDPEEHHKHLKALFSRLHEYGLSINVSKCVFGVSKIDFLGFHLSEEGIQPLPDKKGIKIKKKTRSTVPQPTEQLQWNDAADAAFRLAKNAIAEAALLRHPIPGASLSIWVDASDVAIGGTLMQLSKNQWEPIAFFSMKLNKSQQNGPLMTESYFQFIPQSENSDTYHNLICDTSTGTPRPFVPTTFRKLIFEHLHNLSHPGIAATTKLICSRYVWPCMKKQIKTWVRGCDKCQRSKVQRHTKSPLGTFSTPDARFSHIHIDIVGPLPPSDGFQYLLTMIDRFSRWPEAVPIPDTTAKTISRAIFHH
ncbi:uncharacterized protein K02A2.6 [Trichonephila clavipes]|nr:uncharacterized protein K02A2.6 [Trichonephila clavipes]